MMFQRACLILSLGFAVVPALPAAVSLAGGAYQEDFDDVLDANAWTLSTQTVSDVVTETLAVRTFSSSGYQNVTVSDSTGDGRVTGARPTNISLGTVLTAIKTPGSYTDYGFSGGWLTNNGSLSNSANGNLSGTRTATLSFNNLSAHTQINSIGFLLAAGDSIDATEGVFEVLLDGNVVFRRDFESGGVVRTSGFTAGYEDVGTNALKNATEAGPVVQQNLLGEGFYREVWQSGADDASDRNAETWTLESAYRVQLDNLAHTSDTLTLEFVWRGFNSSWSDEFLAIDNLFVSVPEPGRALLLLGSLGFMAVRRRRSPVG